MIATIPHRARCESAELSGTARPAMGSSATAAAPAPMPSRFNGAASLRSDRANRSTLKGQDKEAL